LQTEETKPDFPAVSEPPAPQLSNEGLARLQAKLEEIDGKLTTLSGRLPEKVATEEPPTQVEKETLPPATEVEKVPDAVDLTIDDKPEKPAKVQPQPRKRAMSRGRHR
jgi:hypothetical protein